MNLEELYISHNGIEEIEGLDNLVSGKELPFLCLWESFNNMKIPKVQSHGCGFISCHCKSIPYR